MNQKRPRRLASFIQGFAIVLVSAIISNAAATALVMAWSGPSSSPPGGNVSALLNVGSSDQVKNANLAINGLSVFGNSLLNPGAYLNWGTTAGSGGYGMRDAGGILEFKTATGTWQSIQAIITSVTASSSNSWSSGPSGSIYYSAGNVGVGTSAAPPAVLSVAGAMRLSPRTSAPVTCNASYIGAIAVSDSTSHLCVCNGTAWVFDYNGAACVWGGGISPGSQSYTTPGAYTFTVPAYNTLTVQVWGGGGGGGDGSRGASGGTGGQSSWNATIIASGGTGGSGLSSGTCATAGGTASGGTTNTTGGSATCGNGGSSPNGGAGGSAGAPDILPTAGAAPGGGGGAYSSSYPGGAGGGYSTRTYTAGQLTVGSNITVVVGAAGAPGSGAASGSVGRVIVTWN